MLAVLAVAAIAFAVTPPKGTFNGKSAQKQLKHREVQLKTKSNGRVKRLDIKWEANCQQPGKFWDESSKLKNQAGMPGDGDKFHTKVTYNSPTSDGQFTGVITATVHGSFPDAKHAKGDFKANVKVMHKGAQIDTCSLSKIAWHAHR
jgi:hypothetical protein